jgi:hypothetical protein
MNRLLGTIVATALAAGLTSTVRADDKDATAILDKAIKALGGEEKLTKAATATWTTKGSIHIMDADNDVAMRMSAQGLDHFRQDFEGEFGGMAIKGVAVIAGDKGWQNFADMKMEMDKNTLANMKRTFYLSIVPTTILPLKGKGFKVAMAGEEKVGDKPAVKIKATGPDGKDFTLFFDKESGLPVKLVADVIGFMGDEYTQTTTYSDYKEMAGIQNATKVSSLRDGKKFIDQQVTDFKIVDKLDAKTFAEPE